MNKTKSIYQNCLQRMFALQRFGIKLELDTILGILKLLGDPHLSYRCIHIAGTNGKGSIASSLALILHNSGYRVGLFTSPHLIKFNERIQINGKSINDEQVVSLYETVRKADQGERKATFFEFATAMAFYEFAYSQVDWAVIETGMGGRLDATNIIRPRLSVITNISLEHQAYLGNTLTQIAMEKGGIIKPDIPVVTGVSQKSVISVIEKISRKQNASCYRNGKDFCVRRNANGHFDYIGMDQNIENLTTGLAGKHQSDNAAVVLAACEQLIRQNMILPQNVIRSALKNNHWPGRLEKALDTPRVILDGAHNQMAAHVLSNYIKEELKNFETTLVIGILDDKPYEKMLKSLVPVCRRIILTQPNNQRAIPAEKLLKIVSPMNSDVEIIKDVTAATLKAIKTCKPDEAVCIAGSLYVVGEAKETISKLVISSDEEVSI
jgi:dihydrofolate synthase/folylpolyglutamate synthase